MAYALTPEAALLTAAALAAAAVLVLLFVRFPVVGISALAGGQAWEVMLRGQVPVLDVGLNLYPLDLLAVCAAIAAVVSLVRYPVKPHLGHAALAVLVLLVTASLVTGMRDYGVQVAGNEARVYFLHVLAAVCYIATVRPGASLDRTVVRVWTALACVYGVTAMFWWNRVGIGSNADYVLIEGQRVNSRPVGAASAFVIMQSAVMLLCKPRRGLGTGLLAGTMVLIVVLLQHRTVWLAAVVMAALWLVSRPGQVAPKAAGIGAVVLLASLSADAGLTRDLALSATNEDTLVWRIDSWRLLIGRLNGIGDWLFGLPFGSGFTRFLYGAIVEAQPHNYYLHLLLRVGLLGLCAAVMLVLAMLRRADHRTPTGLVLWLTMAGLACYCLSYSLPFEQSLLVGLLLRQPDRSRVVRRATLPQQSVPHALVAP